MLEYYINHLINGFDERFYNNNFYNWNYNVNDIFYGNI